MDDQERARYERIPEPVRDIFCRLEDELIELCFRWKLYGQLYRQSERRIGLLNATAAEFFHHMQFIHFDYVVLGICRLTDRPTSFAQRNLVVQQLVDVECGLSPTLVGELNDKILALKNVISGLRKVRDKRIAHLDLDVALALDESPIPGIKYIDVDAALKAMCDVMNAFRVGLIDYSMAYEDLITQGDASTLIASLARGAAHRALEKQDAAFRHRLNESEFWGA